MVQVFQVVQVVQVIHGIQVVHEIQEIQLVQVVDLNCQPDRKKTVFIWMTSLSVEDKSFSKKLFTMIYQ